jgi:hypothetical protein
LTAERGFTFLASEGLFGEAAFLAFGEAVIRPGRVGFRDAAFFPLVARIFCGAVERLLLAFVIRLLIVLLRIENEPAPLNPARTLVYGWFYINYLLASQEIPFVPTQFEALTGCRCAPGNHGASRDPNFIDK